MRTIPCRKFIVLSLVLTVCAVLAPGPVQGQNWQGMGRSDFPSFVSAVVFSGGAVLQAGRSVTWGKWTVKYVGAEAVADFVTAPNWNESLIVIKLNCQNPVSGTVPCRMFLWQNNNCLIMPGHTHGARGLPNFKINCPRALRLR